MKRSSRLFTIISFCIFISAKAQTADIDLQSQSSLQNTVLTEQIEQKKELLKNSFSSATASIENSNRELVIDLKNPSFSNGVLSTEEGGIIKNTDLRIQAEKIKYVNRKNKYENVHRIEAENSIIMVYKDRVFTCEKLEYDFTENKGILYKAKTFSSPWYLSGDRIILEKDGNYKIEKVSITTCENVNSAWDIHAGCVSVEDKDLIKADKVRFRIFSFPAVWLPSFKINLQKFKSKPIIGYKVNWDKATGPRASIRYEAYSWRDLALYLRLDYRLKMGLGGAIETEYLPEHKRTTFITRSYLAQDMIPNDLSDKRRYRFQGVYHHKSTDNKTTAFLTWDKYSDIRMPNDFKCDDFELDTGKKTEFMWRHEKNDFINIIHSRARVNPFESINQDLPTIYINTHPLKFEKSGIISYNWAKIAYLDYVFSDDICYLKNLHAFRGEVRNEIYRPIYLNCFTLTPRVGFAGIFYNNSPSHNSKPLASFLYGGKAQTNFFRLYNSFKHIVTPYVEYRGLTHPTVDPDNHYIFSLADGYYRLNLLRAGLLNQLFSQKKFTGKPLFEVNAFTNCFFGTSKTKLCTPKGYLTFTWNFPTVCIFNENCWNIDKKKFDYTNTRIGWTISAELAVALEIRYRSEYDWRKADRDNFILDVTREEEEMLLSPLSDRRSTFLAHFFYRINPYWTLHFQSHHGWNRKKEKGYNEYKIDLTALLSTSWKIALSYQHTEKDDRFTFDYFLLKF